MNARREDVLVVAARDGSSAAFGELVDRYREPVVRLAYRMTHDADEAKDIAQDAFLRAFRRIGSFESDRPFSRWLFVIAKNASLDAMRRRRRASLLPPAEASLSEPSPEDIALRNEEAARVRAALAALPPKYREVLEYYYLEGLRYREIAERLAMPIGTVKTYILRAKMRLRRELELGEARLAA